MVLEGRLVKGRGRLNEEIGRAFPHHEWRDRVEFTPFSIS
jgi:hypothetical protein